MHLWQVGQRYPGYPSVVFSVLSAPGCHCLPSAQHGHGSHELESNLLISKQALPAFPSASHVSSPSAYYSAQSQVISSPFSPCTAVTTRRESQALPRGDKLVMGRLHFIWARGENSWYSSPMKSRQTNPSNNQSDAAGFRLEEGGHIQAVAAERCGSVSQCHNSPSVEVTALSLVSWRDGATSAAGNLENRA